jgi:hypothetical protein
MKRIIALAVIATLAPVATASAGVKDPKTSSPGYVVKSKPLAKKHVKQGNIRLLGRRWS